MGNYSYCYKNGLAHALATDELPVAYTAANSGIYMCIYIYIQCVQKVAVHLQKLLEVMFTSVDTGLNAFNFIRKRFLQICVRKVAVHLQKVLEVMSTSVDTGLNAFNFIRKQFLQICVRKVAVHL
jgi:hypothetical protein